MTRCFDVFVIRAWTNGWANNQDAGDLRRHHAHKMSLCWCVFIPPPNEVGGGGILDSFNLLSYSFFSVISCSVTNISFPWTIIITVTPWCLKSPDIDCLLNSLSRLTTKKPSKVKLYSPFVKGIYRSPHYTHIGPVMRNACLWWRHLMGICSALLAICEGNPSVTGLFPQRDQWRGALMFLWSAPEQTVEQTIKTPVIWDVIMLIKCRCADVFLYPRPTKLEGGVYWIHSIYCRTVFLV